MKVHFLQHVAFEGLASIEPMLLAQGHTISATHFYMEQTLPALDEFDALIIMGGPMSIKDEAEYPWLSSEKAFIKQAIENDKNVLGICLGAQLIASILGAKVQQNPTKEIGWFPVTTTAEALKPLLPSNLDVFHWHGETFDIPQGATALANSAACQNQGFIYQDKVIALQFHLETTQRLAKALIKHCGDELDNSQFVQSEQEILSKTERFTNINRVMHDLLTYWLH